jgi:hypothetical protein
MSDADTHIQGEAMIRNACVDISEGQTHYRNTEDGCGGPQAFFYTTAFSSVAYVDLMTAVQGEFLGIAFDTPVTARASRPRANRPSPTSHRGCWRHQTTSRRKAESFHRLHAANLAPRLLTSIDSQKPETGE